MSAIFLNKSSPSISYKSSLNRDDSIDFDDKIIKLKLKKPKLWNWELTTSKSSPNISFPRILLYDEKGMLLADATESDCVFREPPSYTVNVKDDGKLRSRSVSYASKRHSSSSSIRSKKDGASLRDLNECLNSVVGQLHTNGVDCKLRRYLSQNDVVERKKLKRFDSNNEVTHRNSMISLACQPYETNTNEDNEIYLDGNGNNKLGNFVENEPEKSDEVWENHNLRKDSGFPQRPDTHSNESLKSFGRKYRKSLTTDLMQNVKRCGEFKNDTPSPVEKKQFRLDGPPNKEVRFDLQKSHSAVDIPKREKRKCRRSNTSVPKKFSDSILERMSAFKKRSSSSESDDCRSRDDDDGTSYRPKYFLRSCRAGTLIVCEESFRHRKIRRRPQSYPRISENEENDNHVHLRSEKVIQKYIYPGSSSSINAIEDILNNNNSMNDTGRKSKSRYDDEIDKINKLIEKVSLPKQQHPVSQDVLAKKPKFSSQETSIGSSANSKSKTLSSDLLSSQSEKGQLIRNLTNSISKTGYDTPEVTVVGTINNPHIQMLQLPSPSHNTSSKSSLNLSSDKSHSPAYGPAAGDTKIKRRKKAKELSRSVKESRLLAAMDPSSDEDFDPVEARAKAKAKATARTPRRCMGGGQDYNRRKVSPRNDDNRLHERLVQQLLAQQTPLTGDQILALKSNLAAVPAATIGSSDYIDEPSDEVLLHLVRHLASLKHQQKSTTDKEQQKNLQNLNNHRLPTVPCDIKALEESIDKYLDLHSLEEDEIDDLPEGHPERVDRPDLFLLSDEDLSLRTETETDSESDIASIITAKRRGSECLEDRGDHLDYHNVRNYSFDSTNNNRNDAIQYSNNTQENSDKINNNIGANNCNNDRCKREDSYSSEKVTLYSNELPGESTIITTTTTTNEEQDQNLVTNCNMGSNVSRNSGKGLSGRRTQSSGNLYSGKHQNGPNHTPSGKHNSKQNAMTTGGDGGQDGSGGGVGGSIGNGKHHTLDSRIGDVDDSHQSETCPTQLMMGQLCAVTKRDRNKFCGSLPNHLDSEDVAENETPQTINYTDTNDITDRLEYVTVAPRRQQPYPPNQQQQFTQQQQQQQQQHSPYNNSVSEKETASTSSGSSTFKINQDKPDIQLKLPLTRSNFDPSCDQGYGSERSPEDEIPPPMPNMLPSPYQHLLNPVEWDYDKYTAAYTYNFITKDCTFCVPITKGPRGLGLSISGGIDSNAAFPGLIRVKRLFPHQAAWSTGKLQPGDIILEVNGVSLTGLTNYEALEVLRTMPNDVVLLVCRPTDEQYRKLSPPTEPPKPPQRTQQQATQATQTLPDETYPLQPLAPLQTNFNGEFEIIMVKQQGSLGFTLRKEDESVLGHYVRALVREPATTDGRIKPGDKIVAVNDVPLSPLTHEEAVIFLRQAADTVKLRLYRDEAQTPVAAMSPNSSENKTICGSGKKPYLRPEAINLLSDLAYKKQIPAGDSTESSIKSNNTSPRRLRRGNKQQSNSGNTSTSEVETTDSKSSSNQQYLVSSQTTSVCSDSEQSMVSQCSYIVQAQETADSELFKMPDDEDRPDRPNFLDLAGQSGSTPVVSRKPRFQFTVASNAYELNNLDNDALDAPIYTGNENGSDSVDSKLPENHEFTSLPCETFLIACKTESDLKNEANFSHKNPLYQSAHVPVPLTDEAAANLIKQEGNKSLLKWKGVMFTPDDEGKNTPEATDSSCGATTGTNPTPRTESDFDVKEFTPNSVEGHKVVSVELNRGWNSRLGFSLQPDPGTRRTIISAIYNDSVAAKDGRLRVGDQLVTVNDESVENMPTSDIIDLLRIIRGSICITVLRKDPNPKT